MATNYHDNLENTIAPLEILLTIPEVCEILRVSRQTFNRMRARGEIQVLTIGQRQKRVHPEVIRALTAPGTPSKRGA